MTVFKVTFLLAVPVNSS